VVRRAPDVGGELGAEPPPANDQRFGGYTVSGPFQQGVDDELVAAQNGDQFLGRMHEAFTNRLPGDPRDVRSRGRFGSGAERGRVGEREQEMASGSQHPMHLANDAFEIVSQAQAPDRNDKVHVFGSKKRQLGRARLVKLDGHALTGRKFAGGLQLVHVRVGSEHASASLG